MRMKVLLGAILVGAMWAAGCGSKQKVLGKPPKDPAATILAINAGDAPPRVTLQGSMFEKCPQAGCWFRLDDGTGAIKVDTKTAGFVVTEVPLHAKVTVSGRIVTEGNETQLEATGLSY